MDVKTDGYRKRDELQSSIVGKVLKISLTFVFGVSGSDGLATCEHWWSRRRHRWRGAKVDCFSDFSAVHRPCRSIGRLVARSETMVRSVTNIAAAVFKLLSSPYLRNDSLTGDKTHCATVHNPCCSDRRQQRSLRKMSVSRVIWSIVPCKKYVTGCRNKFCIEWYRFRVGLRAKTRITHEVLVFERPLTRVKFLPIP